MMCFRRKLMCFLLQHTQDHSSWAPLRISHIRSLVSPPSDHATPRGFKGTKMWNVIIIYLLLPRPKLQSQHQIRRQRSVKQNGSDWRCIQAAQQRLRWRMHMDGGEADVHRAPGGWRRKRTWECWQEVAHRGCKTYAFITTCTDKPHMYQVKQSTVTYGYTPRRDRAVKMVWNDINRQENLVLSNFNIV